MPREVGGKSYKTLEEEARDLGVSSRTLKNWLDKGVVSAPPEVAHGLRTFFAFDDKWHRQALIEIASRRNGAREKKA